MEVVRSRSTSLPRKTLVYHNEKAVTSSVLNWACSADLQSLHGRQYTYKKAPAYSKASSLRLPKQESSYSSDMCHTCFATSGDQLSDKCENAERHELAHSVRQHFLVSYSGYHEQRTCEKGEHQSGCDEKPSSKNSYFAPGSKWKKWSGLLRKERPKWKDKKIVLDLGERL